MRSFAVSDASLLQERHQPQPRLKVLQDLPASITRYITPVTEPQDILREFQTRRERNYGLLIRRFIYQILHGCANPACTTPTCLSYQRRTTKTPLRKFTPLSARTLACYLASEPNPEASLCLHCPQAFADHEDVPMANRRTRRKSHTVSFECDGKATSEVAAAEIVGNGYLPLPAQGIPRPGVLVRSSRAASPMVGSSREHLRERHTDDGWDKSKPGGAPAARLPRDPKSFTQSLFETLPLRMLEWLPFQQYRASGIQTCDPTNEACGHDGEEPSTDKESKRMTEDASKISTHTAPLAISRKSSTHTTPRLSSPSTGKGSQKVPNGDVHPFWNESMPKPRHNIRPSSSKAHRKRLREPLQQSPAPLSFPEDGKAPCPRRLSPVTSIESSHDMNSEIVTLKRRTRNNEIRDRLPPRNEELESDAKEFSKSEALDCSQKDTAPPTYTLAQIPKSTFTDLHSMQERLEDLCLGYQLTDERPWPDQPKPHRGCELLYLDWTEFVQQSCFYLLKDSSRLARAFEWHPDPDKVVDHITWPTSILPVNGLEIFGSLYRLRPSEEILQSLSQSLDEVFLSNFGLVRSLSKHIGRDKKRNWSSEGKQSVDGGAFGSSNNQAAFICAVVLYALARLTTIQHRCPLPDHAERCWRTFCSLRSTGRILPSDVTAEFAQAGEPACHFAHLRRLTDVFENGIALELVSKMSRAVSNRLTFCKLSKARHQRGLGKKSKSVVQLLIQYLKDFFRDGFLASTSPRPLALSSTTLEWLRAIVLRDWDGQPVVRRAGTVGGALQMLAAMYEDREDLHLDADLFHTPFFAERLDAMEMPVDWLSYRPDNKSFHLLSYPFLFPPPALVTYFRAINFATMSKSFETAFISFRHVSQYTSRPGIPVANDLSLLATMRPAMATYLILTVRRGNVLADAMDQLWRRQKRELMRPLKVRMGMDEGEEGVDHGGVQQEFFRCLFAEALDPAYGMFTVDERTRMTWFQPCSLEPLYKFEMLGILFSIAVYNSITLPVTFPLAFYRKLLGLPVKKLSHIHDGWPDLAKGLQDMLDWSDGDVGDVFMRTYEFSFDCFGQHIDVDMQRTAPNDPWLPDASHRTEKKEGPISDLRSSEPQTSSCHTTDAPDSPRIGLGGNSPTTKPSASPFPPKPAPTPSPPSTSPSPTLVTNANRAPYIKDHISWLTTHSISAQYSAFASGFHTCLHPTALSIFTPRALQSVIEGSTHLSPTAWQSITKYEDGYTASSALIRAFWEVVQQRFDDGARRGLLEFVTASDRVPVGGWAKVVFIVQRSGFGDARLPTSMTCFGRLLLPQYSGIEVLEQKLRKAIEHSKGFGVA